MHVLSVPGKASIEETKAAVVSLKFLWINKEKQKTGKGSKSFHYDYAEENWVCMKQDLRCWIIEYLWKQHWRTRSTWGQAHRFKRSPHHLSYSRDLLLPDPSKTLLDNQGSLYGEKESTAIFRHCLQPCLNQVSHPWHPLGFDHSWRLSLVLPQLSSNDPPEAGNIRNREIGPAAQAHSPI